MRRNETMGSNSHVRFLIDPDGSFLEMALNFGFKKRNQQGYKEADIERAVSHWPIHTPVWFLFIHFPLENSETELFSPGRDLNGAKKCRVKKLQLETDRVVCSSCFYWFWWAHGLKTPLGPRLPSNSFGSVCGSFLLMHYLFIFIFIFSGKHSP